MRGAPDHHAVEAQVRGGNVLRFGYSDSAALAGSGLPISRDGSTSVATSIHSKNRCTKLLFVASRQSPISLRNYTSLFTVDLT